MRTTDLIRAVLDLIDNHEQRPREPAEPGEVHASRFKQIVAVLDKRTSGPYSNTPTEIVADVDSVTTNAGGGLNGPKHPADIRVKDPGAY
jgi:hypothetical protein